MIGDATDMAARLLSLLPRRWFADSAPVLAAVLAGLAEAWAWLYAMVATVRLQTRNATASDGSLDLVARDFFGQALVRRFGESDTALRARIDREMLRERATRPALIAVLTDLTGRAPQIFEPARPADTGAWGGPLGYGEAGGWGSLKLPFQCFVVARRARGSGVPVVSGWGVAAGAWGGGAIEYASFAMVESQVSDADITAAIVRTMPVATIAWTQIAN